MQIVSSYGVEIKKKNIPLRSTLDIFRKAGGLGESIGYCWV